MPIDMYLVAKGTTVSREALLDQALYSLGVEKKYRPFLLAAGWTLDDSTGFHGSVDHLKALIHTTHDARAESKTNTQDEQEAITDAKAFKRKFVYGMKVLYGDQLIPTSDYDLVRKSGTLDRSAPKILDYFAKIRGQVEKHEAALSRFFGGASPLAIFNEVEGRLAAAQQKQEMTLEALPQETLRLYEAMGRVLRYIEKLNTIARIAFDGQAHIIAEFNKDRLLRGRKRRTKSTVEPAGNAGTNEGGATESAC